MFFKLYEMEFPVGVNTQNFQLIWCLISPQVQLLVTESDVENYKQIKTDLDELRNLVEKSELWVYKVKHDDSKKKHKSSTEDKVRTQDQAQWQQEEAQKQHGG